MVNFCNIQAYNWRIYEFAGGRGLQFTTVWLAEWIGYDITTVGQCSWLAPGERGTYPSRCEIDWASWQPVSTSPLWLLLHFYIFLFSLWFKTYYNECSSTDQHCYKSKHYSLLPSTVSDSSVQPSPSRRRHLFFFFPSHASILQLSQLSSHPCACHSSWWDVYFKVCSSPKAEVTTCRIIRGIESRWWVKLCWIFFI